MSDEHRGKIANSNILKALIEHVEGLREMSSTQVSAALGLLRKVMPDLTESKDTLEVEHRFVIEVPALSESPDQWQQQYAPNQITKSPGAPNGHNSH